MSAFVCYVADSARLNITPAAYVFTGIIVIVTFFTSQNNLAGINMRRIDIAVLCSVVVNFCVYTLSLTGLNHKVEMLI